MPKLLIPVSALLASAAHPLAADTKKITYQDDVRAIFENRCLNCHNPDKAKGGLDLSTYTNAMAGGSSGEIINPGSARDSRLYRSVAHIEDPKMPPEGDRLAKAELDLIASWINSGVLETSGSTARKPKRPAFNLSIQNSGPGKPEGPPPMPEHLLLDPPVVTPRASAQAAIASSPWAPLVALTGQKQVLLYNTDSHQLVGVLPFDEGFPEHLSFSRNGSLLLAAGGRGGRSGRVVGWDVKTGRRAIELGKEFDTVLAADITSDNTLVALGGPSRRIKIYHTSDGSELTSIKKHTDWITALSFSPDGVLLATGDRNGGLFVWEAATGNPFYTLKAHSAAITDISWRADSNIVASASEDGSIRLWEMTGGKQVKNWTAHGSGVTDLDFARDGKLVSVGRDNHVKVWDQNGSTQTDTIIPGDIPTATAFSHDGKKFITGDWAGEVTIWDSDSGQAIAGLSPNPPAITSRLAKFQKRVAAQQSVIAAATKKHTDLAAALPPVQSRGTQAQRQINSLSALRQAADAELQTTRKNIAEATTARDNATATDRPVHEEKIRQANAALGSATGKIASLDKQLADATAALKNRQGEIKAASDTARQASVELDMARQQLAAIGREKQFWQAAQINTQRVKKSAALAKLKDELSFLKIDLATAEKAVGDAQAQFAAAEKAGADAPSIIAAWQKQLTEAMAKIPPLENRLRLNSVILENKRVAVENLNKIEPKTGEFKAAHASATLEHQNAQKRHQADLAEKAAAMATVRAAEVELEKALETQNAAPALITATKNALSAPLERKAELLNLITSTSAQMAQAEADTKSLWAKYQAALPK